MIKNILDDYHMDFKENWREVFSIGSLLLIVFNSFFIPAIQAIGMGQPILKVIIYGLFLLIVNLSIQLGMLYSNRLGRMYNIMPISIQEKKQYLLTGYWIRVLGSMVVCTGYILGMLLLKLIHWQMAVFMWFILFFLFLLNNTHTKVAQKTAAVEEVMTAAHWVGDIWGILLCVICIPVEFSGEDYNLLIIIFMTVGFISLVGASIIAMKQCYKTKMREIDAGLPAK